MAVVALRVHRTKSKTLSVFLPADKVFFVPILIF